jgi:hypothetical protein
MKHCIYLLFVLSSSLHSVEFYYQNNQKVYLSKVDSPLRSLSDTTHYIDENNISLGVKDEIIIEIDTTKREINELIKKYDLQVVKKIGNRFYLCRVNQASQVFEKAAQIYQEHGVLSSHPNFIKEKSLR